MTHAIKIKTPVKRELVTPAQYQRIVKERVHAIERVRFIPPTPGRANFGQFEVTYKIPVLRSCGA